MDVRKILLPNGLRLNLCPLPQARTIAVSLVIGIGSGREPPDQAGVSHVLEHMCFEVLKHRSRAAGGALVDVVAERLNAETERTLTHFSAHLTPSRLALAIDLLAEMVRRPRLVPAEVRREQAVIVRELAEDEDDPESIVDLLVHGLVWPGHRLSGDAGGTRRTVRRLTADRVAAHWETYYRPENTAIAVAGPLDADDVAGVLQAGFGDWPPGAVPPYPPAPAPAPGPSARARFRPGDNVCLSLAIPAVGEDHPDSFALDALATLLGRGETSRLFQSVRDRHGLAYRIDAGVSYYRDTSLLIIEAGLAPKRLPDALRLIGEQLAGLRTEVLEVELSKAREILIDDLMIEWESPAAVARAAAEDDIILGRVRGADEIAAGIRSVTTADLVRLARRLFVPDNLHLALVGPVRSTRRSRDAVLGAFS